MQTLLLYVLIMLVVIAVIFAIGWFVFGRGEDLPPLPRATSLTRLPEAGITADDVRRLRFRVVLRGYDQAEVDWALERLGRELDELKRVVDDRHTTD